MEQEPTIRDVLNAQQDMLAVLNEFAGHMDAEIRDNRATMATKKDLENFATKKDLERFATKADLERFVTKDYLDDKLANLHSDIVGQLRRELKR